MVPLKPLWVTTGDLVEKSGEVWDREVPADTIRKEYLRPLEQVGYINSEDNPRDRRSKHYRPITGKTGNNREMRDTAYLSLESLKEAYDELGKLKESESEILIQDFDGSPLGLEELHRKYFDDFPRSESFIISGEEPAQPGQSSQNIAASRGSAQIPVNPLAQPSRQSITARMLRELRDEGEVGELWVQHYLERNGVPRPEARDTIVGLRDSGKITRTERGWTV